MIMSVVLLLSIMLTTTVYSAFNTQLQISGEAVIRTNDDIRITSLKLASQTNNAYEIYNSKFTKETTSMFVNLPSGASVSYEVEITNKNDSSYLVKSIEELSNTNPNVDVNIGLIENDIIDKNSTKMFNITITNNTNSEQLETLVLNYEFIPNEFIVNFDAGYGSTSAYQKTVAYGSAYGELPEANRRGYTFDGWYLNLYKTLVITDNYGVYGTDGSVVEHTSYMTTLDLIPIEGGTTIYTNLIVRGIYSYDANGDYIKRETSSAKVHNISSDAAYIRIELCKDDYSLEYYNENLVISESVLDDQVPYINEEISSNTVVKVSENHKLYAKWTAVPYTVTFDVGYGSTSVPDKTVIYGSSYGELPVPTREGYTFGGWYMNLFNTITFTDNYEILGNNNGIVSPNPDYAVTLDFIPVEGGTTVYTNLIVRGVYSYDANGNFITRETGGVKVHPLSSNAAYIRIEVCDEDYSLDYYNNNLIVSKTPISGEIANYNEEIVSDTIVQLEANHKLYAKWIAVPYTVTFDAGDGVTSTTSKTVAYNSSYGDLPIPTRSGYTFDGWYMNLFKTLVITDNYGVSGSNGGIPVADTSYMSTLDLVPVQGGTTLYFNIKVRGVYSYDANGNYIQREGGSSLAYTISPNAAYIRLELCKDDYSLDYYNQNLIMRESPLTDNVSYINDKISVTTKVELMADHKLYAKWEAA